jgi:hypothetical protein
VKVHVAVRSRRCRGCGRSPRRRSRCRSCLPAEADAAVDGGDATHRHVGVVGEDLERRGGREKNR